MEHWDVILDFAEKLDADKTQTLRRYAYPPDTRRILPPAEELETILVFIRHLQEEILKAPPLVPEANELFPEDYPNDDHVRMLEAVVAVLSEARRLGQPFEGDADT
jgi:LmbE family N-acetylglucosaminyl deacetylase